MNRTTARVAILMIGLPIAIVLFGLVLALGLIVFALPALLIALIASAIAGVAWAIASIVAFVYYVAREEEHDADPGNYSLDQTKGSDER